MESTKTRQNLLGYLPALDGLRALAVLAVLVYHANKRWLPGGFLGVEVFFVLSGYLITTLLVAEDRQQGGIDLRQFWLRRARRLLPALWVMLAAVVVYGAFFKPAILGGLRSDLAAALLYVFNWFQIWTGTSYFTTFDFVPLRHLWSLAVEEQFYFLWPAVMIPAARLARRRPGSVALAFALAALGVAASVAALYRAGPIGTFEDTPGQYLVVFGHPVSRVDFLFLGTLARSGGLLLGAALALRWKPWTLGEPGLAGLGRLFDVAFVLGLAALGFFAATFHEVVEVIDVGTTGYDALFRGGFLVVGLATLVVIAAAVYPEARLPRLLLGNPVMVWVGQRSYGLYLYHWPLYQFHRRFAGKGLSPFAFAALVAVTAVVTELSYRLLETPIRHGAIGAAWARLRGRGAAPEGARPRIVHPLTALTLALALPLVGVAALRMARAAKQHDDITQSLIDSQSSSAPVDDSPGGLPSADTVAARAGGSAKAEVPAEASAAPASSAEAGPFGGKPVEVIAVGDSVMLGASRELRKRNILSDAKLNRYVPEGVTVLKRIAAQKRLTPVMVLHLGTNNTTTEQMLERLLAPLAEVPLVLVLTLHIPHEREREETNNALIRALPTRYPNVRIVDWSAEAKAHPEYFYEDGTHLGAGGRDAYAEFIVKAVPAPIYLDPAHPWIAW